MTPGMKMMMLDKTRKNSGREPEYRKDGEMDGRRDRRVDIQYEEIRGGYEPESRNRRRHQNGRFAPTQEDRMEVIDYMPRSGEPEDRYNGPRYRDEGYRMGGGYRMNEEGNRMVGFDGGRMYDDGYSMRMHGGGEGESKTMMGHADSMEHGSKHLDPHTAKKWVEAMGECFTMEETMEALKKRKCKCEPLEFWVIVNAMKSDYPKLAAKYGTDHLDFYADMAVEWLEDRDAKPGKAMNYYQNVVKHE